MTIKLIAPSHLWNLNVEDFNNWRKHNDLLFIFNYFINYSQHFNEWMETFNLSLNDLLEIVPSGEIFKGDKEKILLKLQESHSNKVIFKVISSSNYSVASYKENYSILMEKRYIPYIYWVKEIKGYKYIIKNKNGQYFEDIVFNAWTTYQVSNDNNETKFFTRAKLFNDFEVLKLGSCQVASDVKFTGRNLDFIDLDDLKLVGGVSWYSQIDISYCSARNIAISNTSLQFFTFFKSVCNCFSITNSSIHELKFINCTLTDQMYGIKIENSNVRKLHILNCDINNIKISNSDLFDFKYEPTLIKNKKSIFKKVKNPLIVYDNYRQLRLAFQQRGMQNEARKYYYLERLIKSKCLKNDIANIDLQRKYRGTFFSILRNLFNGTYTFKNSIKYIKWKIEYQLKLLFVPKYSKEFFRLIFDYIISKIEWIIWGYGEKPGRIIFNSGICIIIFSLIYNYSGHYKLHNNLINSFYYSVITFTTLGYGDITPTDSDIYLKIFSSIEALIGALFIGLIVAGFSNRSKY